MLRGHVASVGGRAQIVKNGDSVGIHAPPPAAFQTRSARKRVGTHEWSELRSLAMDADAAHEQILAHIRDEYLDDDEEVDTLGGLIFTITGRVPRRGEVVHHDCGLDFEILDADPRRVKRLLIRRAGRTPSIQATSEGESGR